MTEYARERGSRDIASNIWSIKRQSPRDAILYDYEYCDRKIISGSIRHTMRCIVVTYLRALTVEFPGAGGRNWFYPADFKRTFLKGTNIFMHSIIDEY